MARPKSEQPIKSKILSIRLTEKDCEQLKKDFGSVQKAIEFFLKVKYGVRNEKEKRNKE
jgi:hypothetical protein